MACDWRWPALLAAFLPTVACFGRLESVARRLEGAVSSLHPKGDYSDCVDAHAACAKWAQSGECDSNPDYMASSCPAACNQCQSKGCHDMHESCGNWAVEGEI